MKEIRRAINNNWTAALTYLGAIGISGVLTATLSNELGRALDESRSNEARRKTINGLAFVFSGLETLTAEFNKLTPDTHTVAKSAHEHLRLCSDALGDLHKALVEVTA